MVDYRDDIDADFLRFYRIDLDEEAVDARRFFARADRLAHYGGAVTAAITAALEDEQTNPHSAGGSTVSVDAMNLMIPGLIERVEV